ncbi:MAG: hydrogenase iron-sulfur subunit [Deltaproteobacteria bacterium]|nr:hydrogenase iron-sulfur subunit [Deltaproteobacteria bacterium]
MDDYRPKIVAMVCNWCTYTAADLAGTSRLEYPAEIRLVRLMCTGMIDPKYIIKAFLDGADGVFIGGCHPGDCHYIDGNIKAKNRIRGAASLVEQFGFEPDRLRLTWIGASEGPEFQEHMRDFTETIKALGPVQTQELMVL